MNPSWGGGAAAAALYPEKLILEILRGMRDTADAEASQQDHDNPSFHAATLAAGLFHDVPAGSAASLRQQDLAEQHQQRWTKFRMSDGSSTSIPLHENFRSSYRDEYTSELLPRALVESAIQEELALFLRTLGSPGLGPMPATCYRYVHEELLPVTCGFFILVAQFPNTGAGNTNSASRDDRFTWMPGLQG